MHYFVDGYNLIFRRHKPDEDLRAKRERIIHELSRKATALKISLSIVFDAQYFNQESSRHHVKDLEVLYTSIGETADDFILNELHSSQNPRDETIITSDKWLALRARHLHAHTMSIEEFFEWLDRRWKNQLKPIKPPQKVSSIRQESPLPKLLPNPEALLQKKSTPKIAENLFEHYLQEFEKRDAQEKPSPKKLLKKNRRQKEIKKTLPAIDDMERWRIAFEKNLNES